MTIQTRLENGAVAFFDDQGVDLPLMTDGAKVVGAKVNPLTGRIDISGLPSVNVSPSVCVIGNSLSYKERRTASATYYQAQTDTLFGQLNARAGQHFKFANLLGADGITLTQIVANFDAGVTPYNPAFVLCLGTMENDVLPGTPIATLSAKLDELLAKTRAIGARLIVTAVTPGGTQLTTAANRDQWYACNDLLLSKFAGQDDVLVLRTDTVLADPTTAYPSPITGGYTDGAWHWYQRGASLLAEVFAPIVEKWIGGFKDAFDGTWSTGMTDIRALVTNPYNTGALAGSGNLTGTLPAAGVSYSVGGTGSGVSSIVSRLQEGVPGNRCRIAYTGPASAVWNTDRIRGNTNAISIASAGLAVGDVIQGLWEVEASTVGAGLMGAQVFVIFTGSTGTYNRALGNVQNNGTGVSTPLLTQTMGKRVLATPPMAIPPGTTSLQLFVEVHPTGANASFTVDLMRHGYRKLDASWY